jgi:hypothetical protein
MKLRYAALNLIMCRFLQFIAALEVNSMRLIAHVVWRSLSRHAGQLANTSYHIYRIIINKIAAVQMLA